MASGVRGLPAGTACSARRGMAGCGATVAEWGARASTVEGSPAGQVDEGGSSLELLADGKGRKTGMAVVFSDEVGALVVGVVMRQGGKEEGAQVQVYPEKKAARGCSRLCSPWSGW
jgi:hypothetical protein